VRKRLLQRIWDASERQHVANLLSLFNQNSWAKLLDCGCGDGELTLRVAKKIGTKLVWGVEISETGARAAMAEEIRVVSSDLNGKLPFTDGFFDAVHANQVIEHLYNTDAFLSEVRRVLKPGGYAVVATENLASWHNVFSLLFGWQPFSFTNITAKTATVGNPLSCHKGEWVEQEGRQHVKAFAYQGLKDVFVVHGFAVEKVLGAGYYPFGNFFANLDPRHAHFLALKLRKPMS